jgi:hypothetical protein
MKHLKALGSLLGGDSSTNPFLGFGLTIVVRNLAAWKNRIREMGFIPFSKYKSNSGTIIHCAAGNQIITLHCPPGWDNKHGVYCNQMTFFIKENEIEEIKNILEHVYGKCGGTLCAGGKKYYREIYSDFTVALVSDVNSYFGLYNYSDDIWELPDINPKPKFDHIVQNGDRVWYEKMKSFFTEIGFTPTFGGSDKVQFDTVAFAPPLGIMDNVPFFAINTPRTEESQIHAGIKAFGGPFLQHIAFHYPNWTEAAKVMKEIGLPMQGHGRRKEMGLYYDELESQFTKIFPDMNFEQFKEEGGLFDIDCVESGMNFALLQSFHSTLDIVDLKDSKDTNTIPKFGMWFELIQRSAHSVNLEELQNYTASCAAFGLNNFANLAKDAQYHANYDLGIKTGV